MVDDGSTSGGKIQIEKNGVRVKLEDVTKSRFEFALDYDCEYVFSYMKDGYVTKRIQVSTKVPKEKQSLEFEPFKFDVVIFKQYPGVNTVIYNQPVGKIRFNDVLNEFDYDTDYTKSIQSELNKAEEIMKQKFKEEQEQKALQQKIDDAKKQDTKPPPTPEPTPTAKTEIKVDLNKANGPPVPKPKSEPVLVQKQTTVSRSDPPKQTTTSGIVTMAPYTAALYGNPNVRAYGWINYGNNAGIQEIATKEEFEQKRKEYPDP